LEERDNENDSAITVQPLQSGTEQDVITDNELLPLKSAPVTSSSSSSIDPSPSSSSTSACPPVPRTTDRQYSTASSACSTATASDEVSVSVQSLPTATETQPANDLHSSFIYQYTAPNQPQSVHEIPSQQLSNRVLTFQHSWFAGFPWLHYSPELQSVLCYYCAKADSLHLLKLAWKSEGAFMSTGFKNWKKAKEKFTSHEASHTHAYAVNQLQQTKAGCVATQISQQKAQQQRDARTALLKLLTSIRYLARQGLAIRGHETDTGNFYQLVKLRCDDVSELHVWLQRTTNFMSSDVQNEMLTLLGNAVVRKLVETIRTESQQFAVIVDGTQDCTGIEQESLCVRYVDGALEPHEVFLGLYEPPDTCGETIAKMVEDALKPMPDYGLGTVGKCLGPTTSKGPRKDGCKIC